MPTSEDTHTQAALALLALPTLDRLSEAQVRGQACVWDGVTLAPDTAVNLGPRRKSRLDGAYDWFPQGCKRHTGEAALRALYEHAPMCEPCCDNAADCEIGRVLVRLIRQGRRP